MQLEEERSNLIDKPVLSTGTEPRSTAKGKDDELLETLAFQQPPAYAPPSCQQPFGQQIYAQRTSFQHDQNGNKDWKFQGASPMLTLSVNQPTYLGWSIFNLLCCCLPLGVAALIYSLEVKSEFASGRAREAKSRSLTSRKLNISATILGVFVYIITVSYVAYYSAAMYYSQKNSV